MNINNLARNIQLQNAAKSIARMVPAASEMAGDADTLEITKKSIADLAGALAGLQAAIQNPPAPMEPRAA